MGKKKKKKKEKQGKSVRVGTRLDERRQWARRNPNSREARLQIRRLYLWQFVRWKTLKSQGRLTLESLGQLMDASDAPDSWVPDATESKVIRNKLGRDWLGIPLFPGDFAPCFRRPGEAASRPAPAPNQSPRCRVMSCPWTLWRTVPLTPEGLVDASRMDVAEFARVDRVLECMKLLWESVSLLDDSDEEQESVADVSEEEKRKALRRRIERAWRDWYGGEDGWSDTWDPVCEIYRAGMSRAAARYAASQDKLRGHFDRAKPRLIELLNEIPRPQGLEEEKHSPFWSPPDPVRNVFQNFEDLYENQVDSRLSRKRSELEESFKDLEKSEAKGGESMQWGERLESDASTKAFRETLSKAQKCGLLPDVRQGELAGWATRLTEDDGALEQYLGALGDLVHLKRLLLEEELRGAGMRDLVADRGVEEAPEKLSAMISSQARRCSRLLKGGSAAELNGADVHDLLKAEVVRLATLLIDSDLRCWEAQELEDSVPGRFEIEVAPKFAETWVCRLTSANLVSEFYYRSKQESADMTLAWRSAELLLRSYFPGSWFFKHDVEKTKKPEDTAQSRLRAAYDAARDLFMDGSASRWAELELALPDPTRLKFWDRVGLWKHYEKWWREFLEVPSEMALWAKLQTVMSPRHPADRRGAETPRPADEARRNRNEQIGVHSAFQEAWDRLRLDLEEATPRTDWMTHLEDEHSLWITLQRVLPEAAELNDKLGIRRDIDELADDGLDATRIAAVRASLAEPVKPRLTLRRRAVD